MPDVAADQTLTGALAVGPSIPLPPPGASPPGGLAAAPLPGGRDAHCGPAPVPRGDAAGLCPPCVPSD
eukprot:11602470-Alexandrium_andersonii.AAC.1